MYAPSLLIIKNFLSFKELKFEFRQGEALLIMGKNEDEFSQAANGVGKSAFIEAIAVAISGKPIRDCLTKELIGHGSDHASLSLVLENPVLGHALTINRGIYADSTPAEYGALINAIPQGDYYADWNQFNDWVFKTIGISKNDFFGNYLVTHNNYIPFLRIGDKEKKEFVNRYSGASVVDKVFPQLQADSAKTGIELEGLNKELNNNQARQSVYAEQIQELNDEVDPIKIGEKVTELEDTITVRKDELDGSNIQRTDVNAAIVTLEKQIKGFKYSKKFDTLISQLSTQYEQTNKDIEAKKQAIQGIKDTYQPKLIKITQEEQTLQACRAKLLANIKDYEEFEAEINQHLADEIECPKCKHKFCLRDKEFDIEAATEQLPNVQQSIFDFKKELGEVNQKLNTGIQQKRQTVNQEISTAQQTLNDEINTLQTQRSEIANKNRTLQDEKTQEDRKKKQWDQDLIDKQRSLQRINKDVEDLNTEIHQCEEEIKSLQNSGIDQKRLDELNKNIEKLVKEESTLKNKVELTRKEKERLDTWELNFIKFKSHLANKSIKNIQDYTNIFLEAMASDIQIVMDGYRPLANKKKIKEEITTRVTRNGFDVGSYGIFSGGERGRIDISVILANQELINLNCDHGKGLAFLFIDEILDQMDRLGLELLIDSLQTLNKTIMIVSQQTDINNISEHTLVIRKKNKVSTIV